MLKALAAMGLIVWSSNAEQKEIIFHDLGQFSCMLKSIFYHKMMEILSAFAKYREMNEAHLYQSYRMGQIPQKVLECMFLHIQKHGCRTEANRAYDYGSIEFPAPDSQERSENKVLVRSFFATIEQVKILVPITGKVGKTIMPVYYVPPLVLEQGMDKSAWMAKHSKST